MILARAYKRTALFVIGLVITTLNCVVQDTFCQTANRGDSTVMHLADPTIFKHDGMFYLFGTVERRMSEGFLVYESKNLKDWKLSSRDEGYALRKGQSFGTAGFWAPQVFSYNGKFYMAYTANENIAIAEGSHPAGPFKQSIIHPLPAPLKQIDPFVFIDSDGRKYLYHVRLADGNRIFVAELNDDLASIKPETLKECIAAVEPWENTTAAQWPVAEGPSIIKYQGVYYLFYSANDFRNPDYAVGYATSKHPLGPWKKYSGNPIIKKAMIGHNGPGHGDFLIQGKQFLYVLHTHSESSVTPRRTGVISAKFQKAGKGLPDKLVADSASFHFLHR